MVTAVVLVRVDSGLVDILGGVVGTGCLIGLIIRGHRMRVSQLADDEPAHQQENEETAMKQRTAHRWRE